MSLMFSSVDGSYCATGVGSPVTFSYPIVFHAWIKRYESGGSGSGAIMVSGQNASLDHRNWMAIASADRGTNGARNTTQSVITTTSTIPVDEWFCLTALFHSAAFRQILYNGTVENSNSTSRVTNAPNIFLIGRDPDGSNNFNGLITHAQIWTYGDIGEDWPELREQIATRKPEDVDVDGATLLNYWPDCTTDIVGSDNLTRFNTPVESEDEPALFLESPSSLRRKRRRRKKRMHVSTGIYALTDSLSTTKVIPFGAAACSVRPAADLGTGTIYGGTSENGTFEPIQVDGADATVDLSANVTQLPDEVYGVPFLKIVVATDGNCEVSIVDQ